MDTAFDVKIGEVFEFDKDSEQHFVLYSQFFHQPTL